MNIPVGEFRGSGRPLLRIPPFPGARPFPLIRPASESTSPLSDDELDAAVEALGKVRVGGDYWGANPELPGGPFVLVRCDDPSRNARIAKTLPLGTRVVVWTRRATATIGPSVVRITGACDPWHVLSGASALYVADDDELALIAAIAGVPIAFLDEEPVSEPTVIDPGRRRAWLQSALGSAAYANPITGDPISLADTIAMSAFWRRLIDRNRGLTAAYGFAPWKRQTVAPLLWAGARVRFARHPVQAASPAWHAVWKSRMSPATLDRLERTGARLAEVEDGFIRSAGLGADCVPPLSIVVDQRGAYFDPGQESDLEHILQHQSFDTAELERAAKLRSLIVDAGLGKYGAGVEAIERRAGVQRHILVPGQVEDDRSVMCGGGAVTSNLELLRRVRDDAPDAYILYKPHPDVEAGHRIGQIADPEALTLANEIVRAAAISPLINMVDEVHVNTSLAGFEALLRQTPVTTYGTPFYAGWGLTRDLGKVPARRTAKRTLDELVAATLLEYPRYIDPVTRLPCPPEIAIRRLADNQGEVLGSLLTQLRQTQGRWKRKLGWAQ